MIDNIILLITGTLHQRQIAELRSKCHPLGSFEEMESVNIANTPAELYEAVLVDTPLGELWVLSSAVLERIPLLYSHPAQVAFFPIPTPQHNPPPNLKPHSQKPIPY